MNLMRPRLRLLIEQLESRRLLAIDASAAALVGIPEQMASPTLSEFTGSGQTVAILNSGLNSNHDAFGPDSDGDGIADRFVWTWTFDDNVPLPSENDPDNSGNGIPDTLDAFISTSGNGVPTPDQLPDIWWPDDGDPESYSHGTLIADIVSSVAPDANIMFFAMNGSGNSKSIDENLRDTLDFLRVFNHVFDVVSLNYSVAGQAYASPLNVPPNNPLLATAGQALNSAWAADIVTVAAAGNDYLMNDSVGPSLGIPAILPNTISVGAVMDEELGQGARDWIGHHLQQPGQLPDRPVDFETHADKIAAFSRRVPKYLDVLAPGAVVTGANGLTDDGSITTAGTSFATPFIVGAIANVQQVAAKYTN